jgi:hypothetical protein
MGIVIENEAFGDDGSFVQQKKWVPSYEDGTLPGPVSPG